MMRLSFFLFILTSLPALAAEGIVQVLEAPLFAKEDLTSPVTQYVRKGEKIYIHDSALRNEDYVAIDTIFSDEENIKVPTRQTESDFYATIDKQGNVAFIPKRYVEVLFKDERELTQAKPNPDHTDYRLREPLPQKYPLYKITGFRSFMTLGLGQNPKNNYEYKQRIGKEDQGNLYQFSGMFARKANFDADDRIYFGGTFTYYSYNALYELEEANSKETESKFGIGPYFSYDPLVSDNYKITIYGALYYNLVSQHTVSISDNQGHAEKREFSGKTLMPKLGAFINFTDVFAEETEHLDFIAGFNLSKEFPSRLKATSNAKEPLLWNQLENDSIATAPLNYVLFGGIQKSF